VGTRCADHVTPLYSQKLALTSLTGGGRSVSIVRVRTKASEFSLGVKKPTAIETVRLHRLRWFGHVQRMEGNRIPKRVLYMNLGTTRLRGRPINRWQDEVRKMEE